MRRSLLLVALLGASMIPCVAATDGPAGWFRAGDHPQNYTTGWDGSAVVSIVSKPDSSGVGFGTLMRQMDATEYRGMRVRFTATVRSEDVTGWAGLWMRVDRGSRTVAFDNMQSRAIRGTTRWKMYDVVLNVPADATKISFGTLVISRGSVWMENAHIEPVDNSVPTTAR